MCVCVCSFSLSLALSRPQSHKSHSLCSSFLPFYFLLSPPPTTPPPHHHWYHCWLASCKLYIFVISLNHVVCVYVCVYLPINALCLSPVRGQRGRESEWATHSFSKAASFYCCCNHLNHFKYIVLIHTLCLSPLHHSFHSISLSILILLLLFFFVHSIWTR